MREAIFIKHNLFLTSLRIAMVVLLAFKANAQSTPVSTVCSTATGICSGSIYSFPAGVNSGTAPNGPAYGCLSTRPNPAWFFMQIQNSGSITISMTSNPARDIDYIIWGPFTSPSAPCASGLTTNKIVSCSYSTATSETGTVTNGVAGDYYIILITNYSNNATNITFSQTSGTGTSNCSILCNVTSLTATASSCGSGASAGAYTVSGTVSTFTPPSTGTLTVSSSCGGSVSFNAPFSGSINYTIPGVAGKGENCTITAAYSAVSTCTRSTQISVPTCCAITPGPNATVCTGETLNLSATGTSGGSFVWTGPNEFSSTASAPSVPQASVANSGTYDVYLVNGICSTDVAHISGTVKPIADTAIVLSGPTTFCQGDSVTLSVNATPSALYQWRQNGNDISGAQASSLKIKASGDYQLYTTLDGCNALTFPRGVIVAPLPAPGKQIIHH